ncbi:MAG: hypothetical protein RL136_2295 [Planctomycetota bacterium]
MRPTFAPPLCTALGRLALVAGVMLGAASRASASPGDDRMQGESLLLRYCDPESTQLLEQAARSAPRQSESIETRAIERMLRNLVREGIAPERGLDAGVTRAARARALDTLAALRTPMELRAAMKVLDGEGSRPNFVSCDPEVRRAIFRALAREPMYGQAVLVELAVTGDEPVRHRACDALPEGLSPIALERIAGFLASDRELYINRAASIAGTHASAALIPALVSAQYAPPRKPRGDEAWIAIGNTQRYVQNQIPIVGDASTSFQPVIGTIFEGSLLRIMESVVEIYRTEVHVSLTATVEELTGLPAPPLGYDRDRWLAWYASEFPALAERHAAERAARRDETDAETTPPARDS